MNDNFAVLLAPMGCYTRFDGAPSFQRESQSYARDPRATTEQLERRRLVRVILRVRQFGLEVETVIRSHLRRFDLRDGRESLTEDRRAAASREIFDRVHAAACGRANGTAVFSQLDSVIADRGVAL